MNTLKYSLRGKGWPDIYPLLTLTKYTKKPKLQIQQYPVQGEKGELVWQWGKVEDGVLIKPPAWFLERTQGWIPRGHSYSPWCAPTSWSGLSPRRAEVKEQQGRQEAREWVSSTGEGGGNIHKLKRFRGQDSWKTPKSHTLLAVIKKI